MSEIRTIIQSIHFTADIKLENFVRQKVNKLSNLSDNIIECEVFLRLLNNSVENKVVEIKLLIPGADLFAKKAGKTFEETCDQAVEAVRRQLKKGMEKVMG